MGTRQRKHKTKHNKALEKKERDLATIRAVNELLEAEPVREMQRGHHCMSAKLLAAVQVFEQALAPCLVSRSNLRDWKLPELSQSHASGLLIWLDDSLRRMLCR